MAIANGRVAAFDDDALAMRTTKTQVVDLRGRALIPGLIDHHIHFCAYAASLSHVQLEGARSIEEAVARVAERAKTAKPGELILGMGWNHLDWRVPEFPSKHSLDSVAPNNPVVLDRKDGHSVWINSPALQLANITRATPNPVGGVIDLDANGEPTGILRENAIELLGGNIGFDAGNISETILLNAIQTAHKLGLVGIHNVEGAKSLELFQKLHTQNKLQFRVTHMIPAENLDYAVKLGLGGGFGDEWLKIGGVKIFSDGSLGSQTAWMLEPFEGTKDNCGVSTHAPEEIEHWARTAASAGMMVCTHAIGDRANREVLNVYEKLRREGFGAPLRIEHAQHLNPNDISRFAALNVIASMQPIHATSDYAMANRFLGSRARYAYAFKSLVNAGAHLVFGSDCPVETLDPWVGIHAAVTRERANGEPQGGWYPEEKLSVDEAVRAYTMPLTIDSHADCLVLSQNIFEILPREIVSTKVECTVVGGEFVYTM